MNADNPYRSPLADTPTTSEPTADQTRIARNIRAICILYVVLGSIAVLGGIGMFFDDSGDIPLFVPCLMLSLGLVGVISAIGVLRKRSWGVPFCQIVSALYLLSFPIGTILGGYFLLNIGKVKEMFR